MNPSSPNPIHRAVLQRGYGDPERVLEVVERPVPEPGAGEVVLDVRAAAVHRGDWHLVRGRPHLVRLFFGLRRPRQPVPGMYAAGTVRAVGSGVDGWTVGDEVFGTVRGAWAGCAVADAGELARRPEGLTPEAAASLPHGGFTALQALRDAARVRAGERVLVHGASGAVGALAVQVAAALGARVTATCGAASVPFVEGLGGADVRVHGDGPLPVDAGSQDVVLDQRRDRPDRELRRVLAPGGRVVMVGGGTGEVLGGMGGVLLSALRSRFGSRRFLPFLARSSGEDLRELVRHVEAGALRVPVDRGFGLEEAAAALRHLERREARGGIVLVPGPRG